MHTNIDLILTLTASLAAALGLGYFTQKIGLSPIVGYLLAGVVVGPNTPGFVADRHLAEQLAEVGVILLLFGVGLQFHFDELLAVRRIALPGAIVQSVFATVLGALAGWSFGWGWTAGLVYGMAISVASTVVLIRVLADHHELHTPAGHIAVGWLVVEDLFTVAMLVLLPALFGGEAAEFGGLFGVFLVTALKLGGLVALVFLVGGRLIPWLLERIAATRSRELFTLTVLVVALGVAVGSAKLFGVSMALGAFLAGMVVGRSDFGLRAAADALPMRDAFAVLFFVSTGMLFDPHSLLESPWLIATTLAIVIVGKPLAALAIVLLFDYPLRVGLAVAVALAQIGEFSFMLAALGRGLDVLPEAATNALVGTAMLSISINPLLYAAVEPSSRWLARQTLLASWLGGARSRSLSTASGSTSLGDGEQANRHRAVIVGFGPVGRTLDRLLRENGVEPTLIEMNLETVQKLRAVGKSAVYGDASHEATLRNAGIDQSSALLLTASALSNAAEIIREARDINPKIRVIVRCAYVREIAQLRAAGADGVFAAEGEVALSFTEALLQFLGANPEQIDRERARVRKDLFGKPEPDSVQVMAEIPSPSSDS